jgi:choice-of-anchor B domain-containing protein
MKKYCAFLFCVFSMAACSNNSSADNDLDVIVPPVDNPGEPQTNFVACDNGFAGAYPCSGYDLLGRLSLNDMSAASANDVWGWVDVTTDKEYALIGLDNGTAFVDITDTENIEYLGKLPGSLSIWRDIKVYQDHAFMVSEGGGGIQIFNLTTLRNSVAQSTFSTDAQYSRFSTSHNLIINEDSGFAYAVGTARDDIYNGGVHFIDVQDPQNPIAAGGYGASGYTHDAQVVSYNGPDADYAGREIFIGANENQMAVIDVTDKQNPTNISSIQYSNLGYTHQGWFTEDQRYFILGDELDEINFGFNSRTLVFDVSDLDNPVLHTTYVGATAAIDHNGYVKGDEFFLANYTAGVRMLDISGIDGGTISEAGYFDSYPPNNNAGFDGVWSVYPFLPSGKIIVSDINSGLFIIQKSN